MANYLYIFFQSNILEWPVYWLMLHGVLAKGMRSPRLPAILTLMNSITHPWVYFVFMTLPLGYLSCTLIAEAFAIVSETFILSRILGIPVARTFWASTLANLFSWQFAPMLSKIIVPIVYSF